jgi:hypothetical protein
VIGSSDSNVDDADDEPTTRGMSATTKAIAATTATTTDLRIRMVECDGSGTLCILQTLWLRLCATLLVARAKVSTQLCEGREVMWPRAVAPTRPAAGNHVVQTHHTGSGPLM